MPIYESLGDKTCTVARYIADRYVTGKKLAFISLLEDDLHYFSYGPEKNLVLLFPPFLPKYRWLTHKFIEQFHPDISSVSIGDDDYRQIVVSRRTILLKYCKPFKCAHKKLEILNPKRQVADCSCNVDTFYSPNESIHDQNVEECCSIEKHLINNDSSPLLSAPDVKIGTIRINMDEKCKKIEKCRRRRPDKAIYVPRALRHKKNDECYLQDIQNKSFLEKKVPIDGIDELVDCLEPFKLKDSNSPSNSHVSLEQHDDTPEEKNFYQYIEHALNTGDGHETVYVNESNKNDVTENSLEQNTIQFSNKCVFSSQSQKPDDLFDIGLHESSESEQFYSSDVLSPVSSSDSSSGISCFSHDSLSSALKEDSWDSMFSDSGECLNPKALKELTAIVGNTDVHLARNNYSEFKSPCEPETSQVLNGEKYNHVVELYAFPVEFSTQDLVSALSCFKTENFMIKWVDDCHALAIFSGAFAAAQAVLLQHPFVKIRPLSQGLQASQAKAKKLMMSMEPVKPRPATTATLARRLVTGALGIKVNVPKEQRELERKKILEAKAQREEVAKQRKKIWEGVPE